MRATVTRIHTTNLLVVGPTIHAASVALDAARAGIATTLAMRATSPALEIGSSLGAALSEAEATALPDELGKALLTDAESATDPDGVRWYLLHQTRAIIALEDLLLDAGVRLFYDTHPIGVLGGPGEAEVAGALFGGKFGVAAIVAETIVDATARLDLVRRAGRANFAATDREDEYAAWLLIDSDHWRAPADYSDGMSLALRGSLAEFRYATDDEQADLALRQTIIRRHAAWCDEHPNAAFAIERAGDELIVEPAARIDSDGLAGPEVTGLAGLWALGPAADASASTSYLNERTRYARLGSTVVSSIGATARSGGTSRESDTELLRLVAPADTPVDAPASVPADARPCLIDPSYDEPDVERMQIEIPVIPVVASYDLVIAGGGTSGAQAAQTAGDRGVSAICLEKHSDVGGVSTIGGVPAYWYGRRTPFFKQFHGRLKTVVREKRLPVAFGLLDLVLEARTDIRLRTPTIGVLTHQSRITHALCVSREGLVAVEGRFFIDASGDGDLAAWAGAEYSYGAERDEITLWCSFGSFHRGRDEASRQYMSVVDQRSAHDIARGIVAGRRMGGVSRFGRYVQHYLAPRESRHIRGDVTVTYHDVMMERAFPDTVMCCKSNVDIKGIASSRAALAGYVERSFLQNFTAGVPYGALTPKGLDNVLVVGKAYSITHDGISMARMQPDMISLGAVASIAAGAALATDANARGVDVTTLQRTLTDSAVLLPGDLPNGPLDERVPAEGEDLVEVIERLSIKPVEPSEWARVFARPEEARSLLHRRGIVTAEWVLPQLDHLAATLGDASANDRLFERLDALLEGETLPDFGALEKRHDMPDHGFAPEPVYLINALACTGDPRLVSRLDRVERLLQLDPDVSDYRFSYVHAITYAAELLADPNAGAVAARLMDRPEIRERLLHRDTTDPRETRDYIAERFAYLGLCLARGAARCGLPQGYRRLAEYVEEIRVYLARSSRAELRDLLETDCGFSREVWLAEIDRRADGASLPRQAYDVVHA